MSSRASLPQVELPASSGTPAFRPTHYKVFLARGSVGRNAGDPNARHLYMLDESSLASTRQMQSFLEEVGPQDRVLLVGDTQQHQGVDAGKPFEQMQAAGMRTSQLDQIVRQKDPELLRAVEHLSRNETATGIQLLQQQGRITEIPDRQQRIEAIAKDYVAQPENTLVVSPDNASRRDMKAMPIKEGEEEREKFAQLKRRLLVWKIVLTVPCSPFLTLRPSWFHAYRPATRVASGFCRAISRMLPKL